eukprot:CAMPEP_0194047646 /NCGR_PEP_ID=MMETSP0009_2-20130614/25090_1 /TAXON_ID=210454 /ORGANISM="Grammatophora oceanica, Strain CCMP 410" /LENGTH=419 /DNA_ID=CAMNT_0038693315 /DNA_START=471 /DNA_END=1730 /DNA_ORIENTATION=-
MDEEEMSHNSGWSGSGTVQSGPAGYPGGGSSGFGGAGGRQPLPYQSAFGSGQSVSSEGDISLKRDREREGRCSECGVQTHEFRVDPNTGQQRKTPLTVENEVHRGRCLFCHPFPGFVPSASGGGSNSGTGGNQVDNISHHTSGSGSGSGGHTTSGNYNAFRSTRSINTVSSHGGSVQSGTAQPDQVESSVVSTVSNTAADEALSLFDNESCDLLDILTAMRRFPNERRIQEKGCEKLWIQSWDDENSSAIGRVGGISILLNAMANFPTSQRLQQSGCEALQNLALNDFNRDAIVENGGIRVIVNAMNNHQGVVGVQQCGCTALANLAVSRDNHLDIANAGGLHAIMNSAQNNQEEESVLRAAYQALRAMGYDPNRHGPGAQPPVPAPQQQQQQPTPQEQDQQDQPMDVIRLDVHGFPIG